CVWWPGLPPLACCVVAQHADGDTLGGARCSLGLIVKRPLDISGKAQGCFHFLRGAASRSERGILPAPIVDNPGDDVATVDTGVVEDIPSDIGIVVGPSQVVRLQEGIERGVDIFSGGSGGHGVGPLLVCAFDRSFPICYYYIRAGKGCQALCASRFSVLVSDHDHGAFPGVCVGLPYLQPVPPTYSHR